MLQQILQDMFVDPEILAELSEDQKQTLFCKMREEQIRRWRVYEEKLEKEEKNKKKKAHKSGKNHKTVKWLTASDGNEWVWVMGDYATDKSIEQILEEEAQEKARKLAEKEAEQLRLKAEEEMRKKIQEEQERLEKEKQEKEAEIREEESSRRKAEEAALYQSLKEARLAAEKLEQEKKKTEEQAKVQLRKIKDREIKRSEEKVSMLRERRASELYMSFKNAKKMFEQAAEENTQKMEEDWQEQEKKAKAAEAEMRAIARRAREEHRLSLRTTSKVIEAFQGLRTDSSAPPVPQKQATPAAKQRPSRPPNKQSIVEWFQQEEIPRGAGVDPKTGAVSPWFHGVITRGDSEKILENKKVGTFLVRVSERVWGYTISYRAADRCKHFLIDTSDGSYQFFGTNQIAHAKLLDLISFHKGKPISGNGKEVLLYPCGQETDPPDYEDLFHTDKSHITYL